MVRLVACHHLVAAHAIGHGVHDWPLWSGLVEAARQVGDARRVGDDVELAIGVRQRRVLVQVADCDLRRRAVRRERLVQRACAASSKHTAHQMHWVASVLSSSRSSK